MVLGNSVVDILKHIIGGWTLIVDSKRSSQFSLNLARSKSAISLKTISEHFKVCVGLERKGLGLWTNLRVVATPVPASQSNPIQGKSSDFSVWKRPRWWMFWIHDSTPNKNKNSKAYAHPLWRQDAQVFRMRKVIYPGRKTEGAHGDPQQRKSTHLWSMPEVSWSSSTSENAHAHPQWSEGSHLLGMWEVLWWSRNLEEAHDHPHWGESTQMCGMWRDIWSSCKLEKAHAHPQWGEATQMQSMWLCIFTSRQS